MKLMIDTDGCVRDFTRSLIKTYLEYYPEHKNQIKKITDWDLSKFFPIGQGIFDFAFKKHINEVFYENAMPYDDVDDGLIELKTLGHELVLFTSQNSKSAKATLEWIKYYEFPFDGLIVVKFDDPKSQNKKTGYDGDIYLDDRDINCLEIAKEGKTVVCRNQPWNIKKDLGDIPRVNNFTEFVEFVRRLS